MAATLESLGYTDVHALYPATGIVGTKLPA
jgi:hypothetical protein